MLHGHFVKQYCKDPFLHLSSILSAQDYHFLVSEIDGNGRGRGHPGRKAISWERAGIVDGIVRVESLELFPRWADKHVAHEEGMVGSSTDNADIDSVLFVPSCIPVHNIDSLSCIEVVHRTLSVDFPNLTERVSRNVGRHVTAG